MDDWSNHEVIECPKCKGRGFIPWKPFKWINLPLDCRHCNGYGIIIKLKETKQQ